MMENITFSQIERKDLPLYEEVKAKAKIMYRTAKTTYSLNTFGIYICVRLYCSLSSMAQAIMLSVKRCYTILC